MNYTKIIDDYDFSRLISTYLNNYDNVNYKEYFNHFIENLNKEKIYIPVLGIQGAGKSSFLNAVLMDSNVLPTDVDETTCVPVEVHYGEDDTKAEVNFENKKSEIIDVKDIKKYVHNDFNPGNEMGVTKILLFNKSEILKKGVVLVDLPGVGTLTAANHKTTMDYVEKLTAGIFMIRTNPPITRTEKNFITALWPKLSNTIFVQNRWFHETDEDAEEAKEHNSGVLNNISAAYGENREIQINVVDVYKASQGKFHDDEQQYRDSGIMSVIDEIKNVADRYNENIIKTIENKITGTLDSVENQIEGKIAASKNKHRQNKAEKTKKIQEIKDIIRENEDYFRGIQKFSDLKMNRISEEVVRIIENNMEQLRENLTQIISTGIVDGEILSSIYKDETDKVTNRIIEEILELTTVFVRELNEKLKCMSVEEMSGNYNNISFFSKKSSMKFEKSLPTLFGWGSGLIGMATTVSVFSGPIGAIVGIGMGLVFAAIGENVKEEVINKRVIYTLQDIIPLTNSLENYLRDKILGDLKFKRKEIEAAITEAKDKIETNLRKEMIDVEMQYTKKYLGNYTKKYEEDLTCVRRLKALCEGGNL